MKNKIKYIYIILIALGNLHGMSSNVYILPGLNSEQKKELLDKIRLIGQHKGYVITSSIRPSHKIIWVSSLDKSFKYGYFKRQDVFDSQKDFVNKSIFWVNRYLQNDFLEQDISQAIESIPHITVDQRTAISNVVHCLRPGTVQVRSVSGSDCVLDIKYSDEGCGASCNIQ